MCDTSFFLIGVTEDIHSLRYGLPGHYLLVQMDSPVTIN